MEAFEAVDGNMRHAMGCFSHATAEGEIRETAGVFIASAAVRAPVFNAAFLAAPVSEAGRLDGRIQVPRVYFAAHGLDWSYWLCEDLLDEDLRRRAPAMFRRHGLEKVVECPGMYCERLAAPRRPLPALDCRRVGSAATRLDFCHITAVCFRIPFETTLTLYNCEETWRTDFIAWVGYLDGAAVATAATVTAAGAIGVYSVATLPAYQGRGIAERLTRHAIAEARRHGDPGCYVLQSTGNGFRLYRRLGFEEVTRIGVYLSEQ